MRIPLNLRLYEILLETCFDINDETSIIEEVDELMEHIKKTWVILGINQMLHNLCFTWVLFHRFVATGQVKMDLLYAADSQLADVAKDVKTTKDPDNSKILSSTLSLILGWVEKRLLAYHDTFDSGNIYTMQGIVSLGVSAAKILVEDISTEYRRKKKGEVDVAQNRIDTYIRSSLRTAFAQRMEKADSSRTASKNQLNLLPILAIFAKDVGELAVHYKIVFHDLSHVLWDGLYVGEPSSSRIDSLLWELEQNLLIISETVHERVHTRIITDIMKASCDGFLLVLLAGGPSRAFSRQDSQIIEDDFKALKDLFWANGDGLPADLIDKFSATLRGVLPLFRTNTESLIERFKHVILETYSSSARSRLLLPPASGQWNPTEPNTLLRMLCYRNDETASKFLKKTYNLPKKY